MQSLYAIAAIAIVHRTRYSIPRFDREWRCDQSEDAELFAEDEELPISRTPTVGFLQVYSGKPAREEAEISQACFEKAFASGINLSVVEVAQPPCPSYGQHGSLAQQLCWSHLMDFRLAIARASPYDVTVMIDGDIFATPRPELTPRQRAWRTDDVLRALRSVFTGRSTHLAFPLATPNDDNVGYTLQPAGEDSPRLPTGVPIARSQAPRGGKKAGGRDDAPSATASASSPRRAGRRVEQMPPGELAARLRPITRGQLSDLDLWHRSGSATANGGFVVYRKSLVVDRFFGWRRRCFAPRETRRGWSSGRSASYRSCTSRSRSPCSTRWRRTAS